MAKKPTPTPHQLRQLLRYEPETGRLFWLERSVSLFSDGLQSAENSAASWNAKHSGKEAFPTRNSVGYRQGSVFGNKLHAHRVIWAIVFGQWPADQIDHINGIRDDNRICNLRSVTRAVNQKNQKRRVDNTSGTTGVYWSQRAGKWSAELWSLGKKYHMGLFDDFEAAVTARKSAEQRHGFHCNHGRFRADDLGVATPGVATLATMATDADLRSE